MSSSPYLPVVLGGVTNIYAWHKPLDSDNGTMPNNIQGSAHRQGQGAVWSPPQMHTKISLRTLESEVDQVLGLEAAWLGWSVSRCLSSRPFALRHQGKRHQRVRFRPL